MQKFKTKNEARKAIKASGYSIHFDSGYSGDYAYGSREYYTFPGARKNDYGMYIDNATISKLPGGWVISTFGNKP